MKASYHVSNPFLPYILSFASDFLDIIIEWYIHGAAYNIICATRMKRKEHCTHKV